MGKKHGLISDDLFLKIHRGFAVEVADLTGEAMDLYRSSQGIGPRLVLTGWPCEGKLLLSVKPQPSK